MLQGESRRVICRVKINDVNGVPQPYTLLPGENIVIILYIGNQEVKKYDLADGQIEEGENPGDYVYLITREDSKEFPTGVLNQEILLNLSDASFPNGFFSVGVKTLESVYLSRTKVL